MSSREFNTNIMFCLHATSLKKNITKAWFQNTILWPMVKFIEQKNMKRASSKSRTRKTLGRKRPKNPLGWKRVAIDENDKVEPQQKNTLFGWHNQNKNNKKRNSEETKFPKHKKKHKTNKSGDSQRQWQHVGETCQEPYLIFWICPKPPLEACAKHSHSRTFLNSRNAWMLLKFFKLREPLNH